MLALGLAAAAIGVVLARTKSPPVVSEHAALRIRQVDGGPRYYARFPRSLPSDASYFPIGVWLESVQAQADLDADREAGLNLYVGLTANSKLPLVARSDMKVIAQQNEWLDRADAPGSEAIAGWLLTDETDMQMRPRAGFRTMRSVNRALPTDDGRLRYTNYGKGVMFWNTDAQASRYVSAFQDVVSADNYWFTDRDICAESQGGALLARGRRLSRRRCHRAANYGRTVARVRELMRPLGSRPVWVFVEVGHPFTEAHWPSIEPAEAAAAVWSGIIHGARGVVYFNHSFGGPILTQHALREPAYAAMRQQVATTNARIRRLAPVLNAPFVDRFVTTRAAVDTMTKRYGGSFYVFAGSRATRAQNAVFHVDCGGDATVSVLDEDRTLRLSGGTFEDSFADGNAVHIYRIEDARACPSPAE